MLHLYSTNGNSLYRLGNCSMLEKMLIMSFTYKVSNTTFHQSDARQIVGLYLYFIRNSRNTFSLGVGCGKWNVLKTSASQQAGRRKGGWIKQNIFLPIEEKILFSLKIGFHCTRKRINYFWFEVVETIFIPSFFSKQTIWETITGFLTPLMWMNLHFSLESNLGDNFHSVLEYDSRINWDQLIPS